MRKVISIATQKGGVGKTTTSGALAAGLSKKGFKVLAVDMDPQSNLSFSMGADTETCATVYNIMKGEVKTQYAIQHTDIADVIASNVLLSAIELEFTDKGREFLLREALQPIMEQYDYIVIDSPPGLGILTVNALTASDCVIVPMLSDIFSLQGLTQLYETVEHVKKACNPQLSIAGILLAKYNPRTKLSKEVRGTVELITKDLGIPLLDTYIRNCINLSEAQSLQYNMLEYAPSCTGVQDYIALVDELIERGL
ncbi:AAA family ATPase [Oscillospiraceae bacterium PP1C4]